MNKLDRRLILVYKKTRLEELIFKYNTKEQASFYLSQNGIDFKPYLEEHERYQKELEKLKSIILEYGKLYLVERHFLPSFMFDSKDIILVYGPDGLVVNTLKYLDNQALVGISSLTNKGLLVPFTLNDVNQVIEDVLKDNRVIEEVTILKATLQDGQTLYALNDFYIGSNTHISSYYEIVINGKAESQASSGIIISSPLGSTGWLKSILAGAYSVVSYFNPNLHKPSELMLNKNAKKLVYTVREPFKSDHTSIDNTFGVLSDEDSLKIISSMPTGGVVFSDGIISDYLEFNAGSILSIEISDRTGKLYK